MRIPLLIFLLSLIAGSASVAQSVSGIITDENGEPLPFAAVFIQGTTHGTTSNEKGEYLLRMDNSGACTLVVRQLGYQTVTARVVIPSDGNLKRNFRLSEEDLLLDDVVITDDGRDPAYAIIEKAIERRLENDMPYDAWSFSQYSRVTVRYDAVRDTTANTMFVKMMMGENAPDTFGKQDRGIGYLEETLSEVNIRQPGKRLEKILSTHVSGNREEYGFISNAFIRYIDFSPYKSFIPLGDLAERGLVSPIGASAMLYYRYKLLGSMRDSTHTWYRIQVIPRQEEGPVFSGEIQILDESYAVRGLDLRATQANQISFFDTIRIVQEFIPLNDSIWAPFKTWYDGSVNSQLLIFGVHLQATFFSVNSDYLIGKEFAEKRKGNEIITFSDSALKRDSLYWEGLRPVPLDSEEIRDFVVKQQEYDRTHSDAYLDSLSRRTYRFRPGRMLIRGYHPHDYRRDIALDLEPLLLNAGFNPMEGFYLNLNGDLRKGWKKGKSLTFSPGLRYGFSNHLAGWRMGLKWDPGDKRRESLNFVCSDRVHEISDVDQISPLQNELYALFVKQNYLALYRRRDVSLAWKREWLNGFVATLRMNAEERIPLAVTTDYSWARKNETYPANPGFPRHRILFAGIDFTWRPGNQYLRFPDRKVSLGSSWPLFYGSIRKTLAGDLRYLSVRGGVRGEVKMRLLGEFGWDAEAGFFPASQALTLADMFHFKSNQTILRSTEIRQFSLMEYYAWSTASSFVQAHAEQAFGGWITRKIPLVKKLGLTEFAGVHFLWTEDNGLYCELNAGLQHKFYKNAVPVRADLHWKLTGAFGRNWGVTVTLPLPRRG